MSLIRELDLDPLTALLTLVGGGTVLYLLTKVRKFLQKHAGSVLDAGMFYAGRFFSRKLCERTSLRSYCRNELERAASKYLQVPGRESRSLLTDRVFVPLQIAASNGDSLSDFESEAVLSSGDRRVLIIGDPGSGKSTLVKRRFRLECKRSQLGFIPGRLPILCELKKLEPPDSFSGAPGEWLLQELKGSVAGQSGFDMGALFDSMAESGRLSIFLDGLDEVPGSRYRGVVEALSDLSSRLEDLHAGNSMHVTMRTQFYTQVSADLDQFLPVRWSVRPFAPADVHRFLSRWPFPAGVDRDAQVARIYNELTDKPTLREMCSNPLVLAMYVADDELSDGGASPDTRTAFYSKVVEELLVARRARQLGTRARSALKFQRESVLGRLAFEHLLDVDAPANLLDWSRAIEIAQSIFTGASAEEAEIQLREMSKETGLFAEERPSETLRFIHLTFCEYLAAVEAVQGVADGWDQLVNAHRENRNGTPQLRTRLVETIPFAVGLLPRARRDGALDDLDSLEDQRLLTRAMLETQAYGHAVWNRFWRSESAALLATDPRDRDTLWTERLHLFNVVANDQASWARAYGLAPDIDVERVFHELVEADRDVLAKVFASYSEVDASASFRLASSIGVDFLTEMPEVIVANLSLPHFFSIAVEQMRAHPERESDWAYIFASAIVSTPSVADQAFAAAVPQSLRLANGAIDRKHRWHLERDARLGRYEWKVSLIGHCMTRALADFRSAGRGLDAAKDWRAALVDLAGPGSYRMTVRGWRRFAYSAIGISAGLSVSFAVAIARGELDSGGPLSQVVLLVITAASVALALIAWCGFLLAQERERAFAAMVKFDHYLSPRGGPLARLIFRLRHVRLRAVLEEFVHREVLTVDLGERMTVAGATRDLHHRTMRLIHRADVPETRLIAHAFEGSKVFGLAPKREGQVSV